MAKPVKSQGVAGRTLKLVAAAVAGASTFLASVQQLLSGGPPPGPLGEAFGFLWHPWPVWTHLGTVTLTLAVVYLVERVTGRGGMPEVLEKTVDVQDKALQAQEVRLRALEGSLLSAAADNKELQAEHRRISDDFAAAMVEAGTHADAAVRARKRLDAVKALVAGTTAAARPTAVAGLGTAMRSLDPAYKTLDALGVSAQDQADAFRAPFMPVKLPESDSAKFAFILATNLVMTARLASLLLLATEGLSRMLEIAEENPDAGPDRLRELLAEPANAGKILDDAWRDAGFPGEPSGDAIREAYHAARNAKRPESAG